ncbi:hypothetical protein NONS58_03790 [Nitrosococcus oceani]|nr:hypothetical protein NONS58_03790 [Nitrosococcus oceani]
MAVPDKKLDQPGIVSQLLAWMDVDAKVTALKSLQGLLWEAGYQRSDFTGHIYPDAGPNLRAWRDSGTGALLMPLEFHPKIFFFCLIQRKN